MSHLDLSETPSPLPLDLAAYGGDPVALMRRIHLIDALTDVILHHLKKDEFIAMLIERVQVIMAVDNVAILRLTPNGDELLMETVRGPEEEVAAQVHVPLGQGVAGRIAASGRPLIIDELSQVEVVNSFLQQHLCSLVGVPLVVDNQVIGVIHISTIQPRRFTNNDIQLLQIIADRVALAIDHAQAYANAEQARLRAEEQAQIVQDLNQRLEDFLAITSHEMRTPMTTIIASLDLLLRQCERMRGEPFAATTPKVFENITVLARRAKAQTKRLNDFITDLLDMSRIQANKLALRPTFQEIGEVIRETVGEQRLIAINRTIHLEIPPQAIWAVGDAYRLKQVIANYVINALKFSDPEQPIEVRVEARTSTVWVGVTDHGLGISEAEQPYIWDRFHQVKEIQAQTGSSIGLGLGLYICKTIIEQHDGKFGVISQLGEGSTFWFTLPLSSART